MKILKVNIARAIWLFPLTEMNPQGKAIDSDLIEWLKKTYQFAKYPAHAFDFDQDTKALAFAGGKFSAGHENGKERYIALGLGLYKDGLVVNTESSTSDGERFLAEVLESAAKEFNLALPEKIQKKLYFNEMDVRLDQSISLLNPKLDNIARRITELRTEDSSLQFAFAGITFLPQPEKQGAISGFALERKIGTDWSENRYNTKAPLQTDAHIQLLEEIESLLVL